MERRNLYYTLASQVYLVVLCSLPEVCDIKYLAVWLFAPALPHRHTVGGAAAAGAGMVLKALTPCTFASPIAERTWDSPNLSYKLHLSQPPSLL